MGFARCGEALFQAASRKLLPPSQIWNDDDDDDDQDQDIRMMVMMMMTELISKPVKCRFVTANLGACQDHRKCRSQLLISPNADLLISGTP